ncbi:MAG TPA: VOC family protein [Anaerolineales bacterium]|nr:VOC family protein [Anaerolineales bacterium]
MQAHLRVARPTDHLQVIAKMYEQGLGLEVLAHFEDHAGFDGIMLGNEKMPYHFEFTHHRGHAVGRASTQDNLLVFYVPDKHEWEKRCQQMTAAGFKQVTSYNPYWDISGQTFEDVDGYRVVIENSAWA